MHCLTLFAGVEVACRPVGLPTGLARVETSLAAGVLMAHYFKTQMSKNQKHIAYYHADLIDLPGMTCLPPISLPDIRILTLIELPPHA